MSNVSTYINRAKSDIDSAQTVWSSEADYITGGTGITGAQPYLETGDDKINVVNTGENVAELYRDYAETETDIAKLWQSHRDAYSTEAARNISMAQTFINEASNYLVEMSNYVGSMGQFAAVARGFIDEAQGRLAGATQEIGEAQARLAQIESYLAMGRFYQAQVDRDMELARLWENDAEQRRLEYLAVLADRDRWAAKLSDSSPHSYRRG
jgi:hypothetical protein